VNFGCLSEPRNPPAYEIDEANGFGAPAATETAGANGIAVPAALLFASPPLLFRLYFVLYMLGGVFVFVDAEGEEALLAAREV